MKTIRRDWLKRQIEAGLVEARCDYHYTDDYAQDAADNFGKSDWMPARIRRPKFEPRQIAEGVTRDVCVDDDAVQGNMNFRESDFTGSCGSCYWENEEKGLIHFSVHSNLSYTLRLKKQEPKEVVPCGYEVYSPQHNGLMCNYPGKEGLQPHDCANCNSGTAQNTAARAAAGVSLTENKAKGGLELRFPSKPAADVLARVKAAGWRWSRFSGCWWAKNTPAARKFAESLIGVSGASVAPTAATVIPVTPGCDPGDYEQPSPEVETCREEHAGYYLNAIYASNPEPKHLRPAGRSHANGTCGYMASLCGACEKIQEEWHLAVARKIAAKNPPLPNEDPCVYWRRVRGSHVDTWHMVASTVIREHSAAVAPGRAIPETVAPEFRLKLAAVAAVCGKTPEQIYALWHEYAEACSAGDQSAIWSEFLEWKQAELKPAAPVTIVARYEDGEVYRTPLDEWTRENSDDEECAAALPRILAGETVNVGGGAAPLVTLSVERPSPAPAGEDYPCSDLGCEDACAAACGRGL